MPPLCAFPTLSALLFCTHQQPMRVRRPAGRRPERDRAANQLWTKIRGMLPVQNIASGVLADIIRRQPASRERTAFAWSVVVGPAVSRVTAVELRDGVLHVTPKDDRWTRELYRSGDTILKRLQALLGAELCELRVLPAPRSSDFKPRS